MARNIFNANLSFKDYFWLRSVLCTSPQPEVHPIQSLYSITVLHPSADGLFRVENVGQTISFPWAFDVCSFAERQNFYFFPGFCERFVRCCLKWQIEGIDSNYKKEKIQQKNYSDWQNKPRHQKCKAVFPEDHWSRLSWANTLALLPDFDVSTLESFLIIIALKTSNYFYTIQY